MTSVLAPFSRESESSAQVARSDFDTTQIADFENEQDVPRPKLSIAIDDSSDDVGNFREALPWSSMPSQDGERTDMSVEKGRQIVSEQDSGRVTRESFGSLPTYHRFNDDREVELSEESPRLFDDSIMQSPLVTGIDDMEASRCRKDNG